mgnify:CR=1 FL=1
MKPSDDEELMAALMTAFTTPRPGHTPVLACVGDDPTRYEPIWPPLVNWGTQTFGWRSAPR